MNKKRLGYFLALLVIILAVAVPAALHLQSGDSRLTSSGGKTVANQSAASSQATESEPEEKNLSAAPKGCPVEIAVVGNDGKLLFAPQSITIKPDQKWGVTPLGALDTTGLPYKMKTAWPDFVDSISDQACQGVSGWMYMVNGEAPMHMPNKHPLKKGDRVIWWYSKSMDQTPPNWDSLLKQKD